MNGSRSPGRQLCRTSVLFDFCFVILIFDITYYLTGCYIEFIRTNLRCSIKDNGEIKHVLDIGIILGSDVVNFRTFQAVNFDGL